MIISVDPQVLGSALVTWVGLFTTIGIAFGLVLIMRNDVAQGRRRDVYGIGLWAVFWGLVGARTFHTIDFWDFYSVSPVQSLYLWNGGLSLWGAIIVGGGAALWLAQRHSFSLGPFADALAIAGLVGMSTGRVGDVLSGERPGTGTSLPWAVEYTHSSSESFAKGLEIHPVGMYELLLALAVLGTLQHFSKRWQGRVPDGGLLVIGMAMLAFGRFGISFVRTEPVILGFTQTQWVAAVVLVAMGVYASRRFLGHRRDVVGP